MAKLQQEKLLCSSMSAHTCHIKAATCNAHAQTPTYRHPYHITTCTHPSLSAKTLKQQHTPIRPSSVKRKSERLTHMHTRTRHLKKATMKERYRALLPSSASPLHPPHAMRSRTRASSGIHTRTERGDLPHYAHSQQHHKGKGKGEEPASNTDTHQEARREKLALTLKSDG